MLPTPPARSPVDPRTGCGRRAHGHPELRVHLAVRVAREGPAQVPEVARGLAGRAEALRHVVENGLRGQDLKQRTERVRIYSVD